jgi:hypothetical protein
MASKNISMDAYLKVVEENDRLQELATNWIRRYEGRLQVDKDECEAKLKSCQRMREELLQLKKVKKK